MKFRLPSAFRRIASAIRPESVGSAARPARDRWNGGEQELLDGRAGPEGLEMLEGPWRELRRRDRVQLARLAAADLDWLPVRTGKDALFPDKVDLDAAVLDYRRYLWLKARLDTENGGDTLCALYSPRIDALWHQHLLDTRAYAEFCSEVFGRFLHHTPEHKMSMTQAAAMGRWIKKFERYFGELPHDHQPDAVPVFCG